jgi:hypothetical protein
MHAFDTELTSNVVTNYFVLTASCIISISNGVIAYNGTPRGTQRNPQTT